MNKKAVRKVGRPTTTSRDAILQAAIELLAEGGETALSFRKLGDRLGLSAPSIYTYFANKQTLLLAIAECVLQLEPLPDKQDMQPHQELAFRINDLRNKLLDKEHLLFLFNTALPATAMLDVVAVLAGVIERAGVPKPQALLHGQSLLWMTMGFTLFETGSRQEEILQEFEQLGGCYDEMLQHLDLTSHERLWRETLERNLLFLKEAEPLAARNSNKGNSD